LDGSLSKIEPNRKRPKTGGRQKGSRNKTTKDIKTLAEPYGPEAVKTLVFVMRKGETHAVKQSAARDLLDRIYGKPAQPNTHAGEGGGPITVVIRKFSDG
jgi:hypothetical protein